MSTFKDVPTTKKVGLYDQKPNPSTHQNPNNTAPPCNNDSLTTIRDYVYHVNYVHGLIIQQIRNGDKFAHDYLDDFIKIITEEQKS